MLDSLVPLRVSIIDRTDLVQLLAEAYADAARREAPMQDAAGAFESIRDAIESDDAIRSLWVLDHHVGKTYGSPLQPVLLALRTRIHADLAAALRRSLEN